MSIIAAQDGSALIGLLLVLLLIETGYIALTHHRIARFKPFDDDSDLAFDSARNRHEFANQFAKKQPGITSPRLGGI